MTRLSIHRFRFRVKATHFVGVSQPRKPCYDHTMTDNETAKKKKNSLDKELIQLSPRVWAPERIAYDASPSSHKLTVNVSLDCRWSPEHGKYQIEEMRITPLAGFPPVSSQSIRAIPVGSLLRFASHWALLDGILISPVGEIKMYNIEKELYVIRDRLKSLGPSSQETLEWVSLIYEAANIEHDKPTAEVSREFGISLRTASNWVRAAREQGLLGGNG